MRCHPAPSGIAMHTAPVTPTQAQFRVIATVLQAVLRQLPPDAANQVRRDIEAMLFDLPPASAKADAAAAGLLAEILRQPGSEASATPPSDAGAGR